VLLAGCQDRAPEAPPPPPPVAHAKPPVPAKPKWSAPAAGPLKYAMVGSYMDAQEKDFRSRLHGTLVKRVGDDIVVSFQDDQLFKGEALSGRGRDTVKRLAELLRHYDHSAVQVGGYTDTSLPEDRSRALSESRARTVADQLVSYGVGKERLSSSGYGSSHLRIATGLGKAEPRNQRIEVRVTAHPEA